MTFIASVIAKEGVAIIADSLVTTSKSTLDFKTFQEYIIKASKASKSQIRLDPKEIVDLFQIAPSHTKDYEEKLYKYDKYTAITTAGSASINGKRIKKLINDAISRLKPNGRNTISQIEEKVQRLKEYITEEVKKFLTKNKSITETKLIVTFYSPGTGRTLIYKLTVNAAKQSDLKETDFDFVDLFIQPDNLKVLCEGQNRLSERLLFGDFKTMLDLAPKIVEIVAKDFGIPEEKVDQNYIVGVIKSLGGELIGDMKIFKLTDLSLQQAVDLASLLMRIEIDIQKYTENIPTVGGVIKLAVIDSDGFRFIAGNEIVRHESF